jgi:hypothetical protein
MYTLYITCIRSILHVHALYYMYTLYITSTRCILHVNALYYMYTRHIWAREVPGVGEAICVCRTHAPPRAVGGFVSQHAGFAVQPRQLWRGNEPGFTKLVKPNRPRQSWS